MTLSSSIASQPWFPHPVSPAPFLSHFRASLFFLVQSYVLSSHKSTVVKRKFQTLCLKSPVSRSVPFQLPTLESFVSDLPQSPSFQLCSSCPQPLVSEPWRIPTCGFRSSQPDAAVPCTLFPLLHVHDYRSSVRQTTESALLHCHPCRSKGPAFGLAGIWETWVNGLAK